MSASHRKQGFTLVELLIVVAIIGVLSTIGVPTFRNMIKKSRRAEISLTLGALQTHAQEDAQDDGSAFNKGAVLEDTEVREFLSLSEAEGHYKYRLYLGTGAPIGLPVLAAAGREGTVDTRDEIMVAPGVPPMYCQDAITQEKISNAAFVQAMTTLSARIGEQTPYGMIRTITLNRFLECNGGNVSIP